LEGRGGDSLNAPLEKKQHGGKLNGGKKWVGGEVTRK